MNKLFTKVATLCVGLAMATGVGVAVSSTSKDVKAVEAAGKDDWVQVTALSGLNTTDTYLIANDADKGYFMNGTVSSGHFQSTAFSATAPASATVAGAFKLVAVNASSNIYKIKLVSTSKYVTASKAGSGGGKVDSSSDSAGWKFLVSGTSFDAIYQTAYSSKYAAMRCYNNTSWRTYSNGNSSSVTTTSGTVFRLYKYQTATLSSISVKTSPKTTYVQGDYFDPTGLVITRNYSDSTSNDYAYAGHTSEFGFSPSTSTSLTTSNTSVTITYGGKSTSLAISVTAPKTPASLATTGQTTSFEAGNTFTYGGTSTVTYTDSTSKSVTPSSFKIGDAGINPISAGTVIVPGTTVLNRNDHHGKTVYVLYEENSTTVYASYTISVAAISKISFVGGTDTGTAGGQGQSDTLTKSGVSMSCDSCYTTSGAYRFYSGSTLTISSTVGNIAKIEFNMNGSYNSNLLSTSTGTYNHDDSTKGVWTGDADSIAFDLSAQARCNSIDITLASNDPLVELAPGSSSEVSMFKGDADTSVKVTVKNIETKTWSFTFDEDAQEGITTSSYVSVSAGAAVSDVHTLTITTKAVGSTTLHISVSGTECATAIPVTVNAKPASMTIDHSDIHEGELEIITGLYKQVSFSGLDTDGNPYSIAAADVTPSATSGASYVTLSGSRITGKSQGTAVVRYTLNALTSVYAEVTVNVVDDYIETVGEPTFATGLTDTQGQSPDVSVFTSRPGTMHSGSSTTIPFENYKFSYYSTYASAEYGDVFSYDFSHGTTVDSTHKLQTIYVFCDIDEAAHGSYTVTVEQFNDPLTAITLTNVTDNELSVSRGDSFQLEWAYTPTNPTDGKEVVFSISENDNNIDITVSSSGLISIGSSSNLGSAMVTIESAHDSSISDFVIVSATLESMTYTVRETESWTKADSISAGDQIIILNETATRELTEVNASHVGVATEYSGSPSHSFVLTVGTGNAEGSYTLSNNGTYLAYTNTSTSKNNNLYTLSSPSTTDELNQVSWTIEISNGDATITNVYNTNRQLQYNASSGQERFCCYVSAQTAVQIYKKSGGDTPYTVTEALFNAVHNNFGEGKTYEWSDSCPSFDDGAWADACEAIIDLANYSSYKLNRAVADASGNEIEVFLAKYDNIITKFTDEYDYLERFAVGGINHGSITKVNSLSLLTNNGTEVAIIVVASMIGLSAVGGYFFLRKRKENI